MYQWLSEFLQQNIDHSKATHLYNPTKSYLNVPLNAQRDFWLNYCMEVHQGNNPYLCEYNGNKDTKQLGFDIYLTFDREQVTYRPAVIAELIKSIDRYVQHIIGIIQSMMSHYFEKTTQGSELFACYLKHNEDQVLTWKDISVDFRCRLIFPYARIQKSCSTKFHQVVVNHIQLHADDSEEYLSVQPINGYDTLIRPLPDDLIEMYGSSQNKDISPYKLFEMYGILNSDIITTVDVGKMFVPSLHSVITQSIITHDIVAAKLMEFGIGFWLPLFFSVDFFSTTLKVQDGFCLTEEAPAITMKLINESGDSLDKLERARKLLTHISRERVSVYWSWIDVGKALYSVDSGPEGLALWKWVTAQDDFKGDDDCEREWYGLGGDDLGDEVDIGTIEYFASLDNPQKYELFRDQEIRDAINQAVEIQEHTQIANAFHKCYPHQFICANYEHNDWYYYSNHRWVSCDGISTLMRFINTRFQGRIEQMRADLSSKVANSRDAAFKSRNEATISAMTELIRKLSQHTFKKNLCDELKLFYHKPRFNEIRDMNIYYTATPTGVIDLRGEQVIVRPGKPQDYITKSTRYGYPHDYSWNHKHVRMFMDYIKSVFRSKALRDYFLLFGASLLKSGNTDKIFPIFSGEGDNSKSILVRIFEAALGSYAVKLPTSLITEKRTAADAATPALIHARGAKVAFLQEPNQREVIQSGTVKELTGNDSMYVRDLFQKGNKIIEMVITMVIVLIANKIPIIPDCQQAIWARTRVVNFTSKWSSEAPTDPDEQFRTGVFKLDKFFDRNIPLMAPAFLWIMVEKYKEYIAGNFKDPAEVLEATNSFRVANNCYIHYLRDCTTTVLTVNGEKDRTAEVTVDELFTAFRKWYADQQFRVKIPTKIDFKENIEQVLKVKAVDNKWIGMRLNAQSNILSQILSY